MTFIQIIMIMQKYLLPVRIHVSNVVVHLLPLIRLLGVGHSLGLAEVRSEAVIPLLGLIEIHLDQGQQHLRAESLHLTILDTREEPFLGLADPHHIVEAIRSLEVIIAEVKRVQLIRCECPVLTVCHRALTQSGSLHNCPPCYVNIPG